MPRDRDLPTRPLARQLSSEQERDPQAVHTPASAAPHPFGVNQPPTHISPRTLQQTLGNQAVQTLLQPKRRYDQMPFQTRGADSLVTDYANDTHATVFPDDQQYAGPLGFTFLSKRWVSTFHITQNNGAVRAFYTDQGAAINTNLTRGSAQQVQGLSGYKDTYLQAINAAAPLYSEAQAVQMDAQLVAAEQQAAAQAQAQAQAMAAADAAQARVAIHSAALLLSKDQPEPPDAAWFAFFRANRAYASRPAYGKDQFVQEVKAEYAQIRAQRTIMIGYIQALLNQQAAPALVDVGNPGAALTTLHGTHAALATYAQTSLRWIAGVYNELVKKKAAAQGGAKIADDGKHAEVTNVKK
jgi:hypothetical protein